MEQPDNRTQGQDQGSERRQQERRGQQPPNEAGGQDSQRPPEIERRRRPSGQDAGRDPAIDGSEPADPDQADSTKERDDGLQQPSQGQRQR